MFLCIGNKIADEVRKIDVSYSPAANKISSSHINEIPRRPKGKGKYQLAIGKYGSNKKKTRSSAATFQKNCMFWIKGTKQFHTVGQRHSHKGIVTSDTCICYRG